MGTGLDCKFCHLCPPREVQRRKRFRRRLAREQLAREQGWFGSFRERIKNGIARQSGSTWVDSAGSAAQLQGALTSDTCIVPTSALGSLGTMVLGSIVPVGLVQPIIPHIPMAASSVTHQNVENASLYS